MKFFHAPPLVVFILLLAGVALGVAAFLRIAAPADIVEFPAFRYFDAVDHLLALALGWFAAYRWSPSLGAPVIALSGAGHTPFLVLRFTVAPLEVINTASTFAIAFAGVAVIAGRARAVTLRAEALAKQEAAERALEETRERYRFLFRHTRDGIALVDVASERFIEVNEALARIAGRSAAELKELTIREASPMDVSPLLQMAKEAREPVELGEVAYTSPAGVARTLLLTVVPLGNNLVFSIVHDITDLKRQEESLRGLSRRLVDIQESERRFLARELHDEIGQQLTGIKLILDMVGALPVETALTRAKEASALLAELIERVSDLSMELRPPMLDELDLVSALRWHFERYSSQTGVDVDFGHSQMEIPVPSYVKVAAYRLVQEALTNVARHANVAEVRVRVTGGDRRLRLEVEDHGAGFDASKVVADPRSVGLRGMRERASFLGGWVTIHSAPGVGTRVMAELPLPEGPQDIPPPSSPWAPMNRKARRGPGRSDDSH